MAGTAQDPTTLQAAGRNLLREVAIALGTTLLLVGLVLLAIGADLQSSVNSIANGCAANPTCQLNSTAYAQDSARALELIVGGIVVLIIGVMALVDGLRRPKAVPGTRPSPAKETPGFRWAVRPRLDHCMMCGAVNVPGVVATDLSTGRHSSVCHACLGRLGQTVQTGQGGA